MTRSPTLTVGTGDRGLRIRIVDWSARSPPAPREDAAATSSTAARASARTAPVSPVETSRGALPASAARLRLQLRDDIVNLAARLADLRLELVAEPLAGRVLALPQRFFTLAHPRFGCLSDSRSRADEALLVLERAHVPVDLRQVFRELRFAGAQVLAAPR